MVQIMHIFDIEEATMISIFDGIEQGRIKNGDKVYIRGLNTIVHVKKEDIDEDRLKQLIDSGFIEVDLP